MMHPDDPAYNGQWWDVGHPTEEDRKKTVAGFTKREEFIRAAMMGLCSRSNVAPNVIAAKAVKIADAVIEEINDSERSQEIVPETPGHLEPENHENA